MCSTVLLYRQQTYPFLSLALFIPSFPFYPLLSASIMYTFQLSHNSALTSNPDANTILLTGTSSSSPLSFSMCQSVVNKADRSPHLLLKLPSLRPKYPNSPLHPSYSMSSRPNPLSLNAQIPSLDPSVYIHFRHAWN